LVVSACGFTVAGKPGGRGPGELVRAPLRRLLPG